MELAEICWELKNISEQLWSSHFCCVYKMITHNTKYKVLAISDEAFFPCFFCFMPQESHSKADLACFRCYCIFIWPSAAWSLVPVGEVNKWLNVNYKKSCNLQNRNELSFTVKLFQCNINVQCLIWWLMVDFKRVLAKLWHSWLP